MKTHSWGLLFASSIISIIMLTGCKQSGFVETTKNGVLIDSGTAEALQIDIRKDVPVITYDQIDKIQKDMTYREVLEIIGDGENIGSGICI